MSTTKPCFANTANSVGRLGLGANGSYKELYQHFGITAEKVAQAALSKLS
jgi:hypothetical protein